MSSSAGVRQTLRRFQRRALVVLFLRGAIAALLVAVLSVEAAWLSGVSIWLVAMVAAGLGLASSAFYARWHAPSDLDVARRIDRVQQMRDLIVTSLEREGCSDEISRLVSRSGANALDRVDPRAVFPLEWPRQWRRWTAAGLAVQIVAAALIWRAPAERPVAASLTSLSMPGAAGGAQSQASRAADAAKPQGVPSREDATGSTPSRPQPTPDPAAQAAAKDRAGDVVSPEAARSAARATAAATAGGAVDETAGANQRYRQAAARASDAITQGRVPAALRGVVERYFAAIQQQGKRRMP